MSTDLKRFGFLLIVAGAVAAVVVMKADSKSRADEKRGSDSSAVLVTQYEVSPRTLVDTYETIGSFRANESVELAPEVAGRLVKLPVEEGQPVAKGTLIAELDASELRAKRREIKRKRKLAELKRKRHKSLLEKGGVSKLTYEQTAAEVDILEARAASIDARLDDYRVVAPFSGVVGLREVSPGARLSAGQTIARLSSVDPIKIEFTVPEKYARRVDNGMKIGFRASEMTKPAIGTVYATDVEVDEQTRALRVRAKAPNPAKKFRPGKMASVFMVVDQMPDAIAVPTRALLRKRDQVYVYVNEKGKATKRSVELGMQFQNKVQVKQGLETGDRVILTGLQKLEPGSKIKVDTSKEAIDVESIAPDPNRPGMRLDVFGDQVDRADLLERLRKARQSPGGNKR